MKTNKKIQELAENNEIDFSNFDKMARDCWLFLTNDSMPEKATIKKEAFFHEFKTMIEAAVSHAKACQKISEDEIENLVIMAVGYGFTYAQESQHDGKVPVGNILQWYQYIKNKSK